MIQISMHGPRATPLSLATLALFYAPLLPAQGVITTIAGSTWIFPRDGRPAAGAPMGAVPGITFDAAGNLLVADRDNDLILKILPNGTLTVIAGNGIRGYSGDGGAATDASLYVPSSVAMDALGNVYVSDNMNFRVRKIAPNGTISTIYRPISSSDRVVADRAGTIYLVDSWHNRVGTLNPDGTLTVVAGTGAAGFSGDGGPATSASLSQPAALAFDTAGNMYIADWWNCRVRKVDSKGIITTVAGNGGFGVSGDGGLAINAELYLPSGVAVDSAGNLYIATSGRVRRVDTKGVISTVAGTGGEGSSGDGGPAINAAIGAGSGLAVDAAGNLYIGDMAGRSIRKVNAAGIISTFAGGGNFKFGGDGGPATTASLSLPWGLAVADSGILIADTWNKRIRKVRADGVITTVAGGGNLQPGVPASSNLEWPVGVAADAAGNVYIADQYASKVRKLGPDGTMTVIAGFSGPPGTTVYPTSVALDATGSLFITDNGHHRVVKLDRNGTFSTIAGTGTKGFSGDGGPATAASLNLPTRAVVDAQGNVYISDSGNNRVRKVDSRGTITTVAGTGASGFSGDGGPATSAGLSYPRGLAVDTKGNLYLEDSANYRIRMVSPAGVITTFAGTGAFGFTGDGGPATEAAITSATDIAVDAAGNVYFTDNGSDRVRVILASKPSYSLTPASLSFEATAGAVAAPQQIQLSSSISGLPWQASIHTSSGEAWLTLSQSSGRMPQLVTVNADAGQLAPGTYDGTIEIASAVASPAQASPAPTVAVRLTVTAASPPKLGLGKQNLAFSLQQAASSAAAQLSVFNQGGGSLRFNATASTDTGGEWLQVSPESGTVTATGPAELSVTAIPGNLAPGTYSGAIIVRSTDTQEQVSVLVTMAVSAASRKILVSQSGLTFTAVAQGGVPLPQSFGILNTGQGSMNWSARASTLSGGSNWLTVSPTSGAIANPFLDVASVDVGLNAAGLAPGDYYGQIQVTAAGADNSPQIVSVVLNVLPPGSNPGPETRPTGLIFIGQPGNSPGSQTVLVSNPSAAAMTFGSSRTTVPSGGNWFVHLPADATVKPEEPTRIVVQPDYNGLTAGTTLRGFLSLGFLDGTARTVSILAVVAPPSGVGESGKASPRETARCSPQTLRVEMTSLRAQFVAVVGQPTRVEARVVDECGNLHMPEPGRATALVVANFSNQDRQIDLTHVGNGVWSGTWVPVNPGNGSVTVAVTAIYVGGPTRQAGQASCSGQLQVSSKAPLVTPRSLVQAASFAAGAPIAPGTLVSLFGANLAEHERGASALPLPSELDGTQVLLGGKPLPLLYTNSGQVNAQVPYDLPVNTQHQVLVRRGAQLSVPEQFTVAAAQPGIFTTNQQGWGPGVIFKSDGTTLAEPATPALRGETVVIYCTGLGLVNPAVDSGQQAPFEPLSWTTNPVEVTIGGKPARVDFRGLTPGYAGLYQVNAVVPADAATGDQVEVTLSVAGQTSNRVAIAVR